jgi:hypothetical protein
MNFFMAFQDPNPDLKFKSKDFVEIVEIGLFPAVLGIPDILVRIRMRIRTSD